MKATLTYTPYPNGAAVTKSLADWGINEEFAGSFNSAAADRLDLQLAGAALTDSPFAFRSRMTLALDGKPFFSGYIPEDFGRDGEGTHNQASQTILGPWWYLENLPYLLSYKIPTGFANNQPVYQTYFLTHFTLNLPLVTTLLPTTPPSFQFTPTLWDSRAQIVDILNYAIANGAWIQYDPNDIMQIPILPRDVLNISCADAIRKQMEDVDCVCGFDHTQIPPKFYCKQRSALPAVTKSLGNAQEVQGFKLKQGGEYISSVTINFEQQIQVGSSGGLSVIPLSYPNPAPADNFKKFVTTIPMRSIQGTVHTKWIKTVAIAQEDLTWWQGRKPEMDPNVNPNANLDYQNLAVIVGSSNRQSNLPNLIIEGGYATWMGGNATLDDIIAQVSYNKRYTANQAGARVTAQTVRAHGVVTDLNFPGGANFTFIDYTSVGENIPSFLTLPKIIYDDLSREYWEGTVPIFEGTYDASIAMGITLNLAAGRVDWETMAALVQEVGFKVKPGGIWYSLRVGRNPKLNAQDLADRMRTARARYITVAEFSPQPNAAPVTLTKHEARAVTSNAEPSKAEDNSTEPIAQNDPLYPQYPQVAGNVQVTGGAGQPAVNVRILNPDGTVNMKFSQLILNIRAAAKYVGNNGVTAGGTNGIGGAVDKRGNPHTMEIWQLTTCEDDGTGTGTLKNYARLFLCSDRFDVS